MCQVCHHEPLDKSLCEPNKTLRMTVKAVLKKKLVEKATHRKREEATKAEVARAQAEAQSQPTAHNDTSLDVNGDSHIDDGTADTIPTKSNHDDTPRSSTKPNTQAETNIFPEASREVQDIPQQSIEV